MTGRPRITALLPAYMAEAFIGPTLRSLSAQTHEDFEVVVSVDLCEDDTHAVCVKHAAGDSRFRVFRQERRLAYVGNCNFLLDQARSDYAFFAFHDDLLEPTYVEKLGAALDAHPEAVLAYSDMTVTSAGSDAVVHIYTGLDTLRLRTRRGLKMLSRQGHWWVPNRGMFRMERARRIGGLKTHGAGEFSPDWPWLFHLSLLGPFVRVPEILCHKFLLPTSLSKTWANSPRQHYEVSAACMRELWNSELTTDEKLEVGVPLIGWLLKHRPPDGAAAPQH